MLGFPIRTPSDHSSVDSSPRPIAASHVLHRLLMPRHPPCALKHLTTTRCSHPLCNTQHTTTPRTPHPPPQPLCRDCVRPARPGMATKKTLQAGVSSGPNSVSSPPGQQPRSRPNKQRYVFHPATPTTDHQPVISCLIRCGISERRPSTYSTTPTNRTGFDTEHTINTDGSLERR